MVPGELTGSSLGGGSEEESFAGASAPVTDALTARWRRLYAHFDDFVLVTPCVFPLDLYTTLAHRLHGVT